MTTTRASHDRGRDHRGTEPSSVITLTNPLAGLTTLDELLIQLAANRAQQASIEDTSGAILSALETEVNKIKAVLRAAGLIGGEARVFAAGLGTGAAYNAGGSNPMIAAGVASGTGTARQPVIPVQTAIASGSAYNATVTV